ncbi:3 beta-hydroxysteroid dehydrogenase type 7-like [Carcharodon carcharias]|uniref:3 beta-hydroxysteroid dehydrogenase type 7-like n=1 Tax=Carcharodon carcharias TaxID=13397 RepID=UPI001B7EA58E|nr:3 beta-hydroxysteroid dehydrogenase type 7-like [Carcharodon carcharias]XP_041038112.1 3 beta-hydroxysteroid dehydrogenase type 7-like [Carcharodon carcharias]
MYIETKAHLDTGLMADRPGEVYLVTGGCGFLGRHLVKMLVERGQGISEIRVFDVKVDRELESLSTDSVTVKMVQGDITDQHQLLRATDGADVILHTASIVDVSNCVPEAIIQKVNVQGTRHVIEACVSNGVQRCVYTSTMEVASNEKQWNHMERCNEDTPDTSFHILPYTKSKAAAEKLILEANGRQVSGGKRLATCVLRPVGIYGEGCVLLRGTFENAVRLGGCLFRLGPHTVQIGRVYVGNVAWMHVLAANGLAETPGLLGGQFYYCSDESPDKSFMSFSMEMLRPCGVRLIGQERPVLPYFVIYMLVLLVELLQLVLRPFCSFCPLLNRYTLARASATFTVQTDKAERHFGYRPLYTWEQSKERTIHWLQSLPQQVYSHHRN